MVAAQLGLLYLCLHYRPGAWASSAYSVSSEDRSAGVVFDANAPGTVRPATPTFRVVVEPPPEDDDGDGAGPALVRHATPAPEKGDTFEWAAVYENQRGCASASPRAMFVC